MCRRSSLSSLSLSLFLSLFLSFPFTLVVYAPSSESLASMKVVKKKVFLDERWSRNRNVTSMDWSTHVS